MNETKYVVTVVADGGEFAGTLYRRANSALEAMAKAEASYPHLTAVSAEVAL